MTNPEIPDIVIGRLPLYLRALNRMMQEGHDITSSHELGERLGISSAQIRKDLSHFGEFGKQGTGYQISFLSEQLQIILNVNKEWSIALVGVGDLGRALAGYAGFQDRGYRIIAAFDNESSKIGEKINSLEILGMDQLHTVVKKAQYTYGDDRCSGIPCTGCHGRSRGCWYSSYSELCTCKYHCPQRYPRSIH